MAGEFSGFLARLGDAETDLLPLGLRSMWESQRRMADIIREAELDIIGMFVLSLFKAPADLLTSQGCSRATSSESSVVIETCERASLHSPMTLLIL